VEETHGYLGFDAVDPAELRATAQRQLLRYPEVEVREARADRAERLGEGRFVVVAGGERLEARRLVLATGVVDRFPEIDNFLEHYGASVFHCPTCDGYEARDRRVVALGWSEGMVAFALRLAGWAADVTVVTDGRRFEGDEGQRELLTSLGVAIVDDDAVALTGPRGALEGVRLAGDGTVPCELLFFSIAHDQSSGLADQLGCGRNEEDCVVVDGDGQTTVPGVYAAGDLTPGLQLVQVAAAEGAMAGVRCALSIWAEDGRMALSGAGYRPGMSESVEPDESRLQDLDKKIDNLRERLEDVAPEEEDDERRFVESGEREQVDDAGSGLA
jgi:thioredoxin reductase